MCGQLGYFTEECGMDLTKADAQQQGRDEGEGHIKVHQGPAGVVWVRLDQTIYRTRHC